MATKTISIDMEAYRRLKDRKSDGESFSEVIKRLVPKPVDPNAWFKKLEKLGAGFSSEFAEAVEETVSQRRAPQNLGRRTNELFGHERAAGSSGKKRIGKTTRRAGNTRAA